MDRRLDPPDGYRRPRVEIQIKICRSGLLNLADMIHMKRRPSGRRLSFSRTADTHPTFPAGETARETPRNSRPAWLHLHVFFAANTSGAPAGCATGSRDLPATGGAP